MRMSQRTANRIDTVYVDIDSSTQYASVFYRYAGSDPADEGRRVATLIRKRVIEQGPHWRLYNLEGAEIGNGFSFAITALKALNL